MKLLPYSRGRLIGFNGISMSEMDVDAAQDFSSRVDCVVRIGNEGKHRYFYKGSERRRCELFIDEVQEKAPPKRGPLPNVWKRREVAFEWGVSHQKNGDDVLLRWSPRGTNREFFCMHTGRKIMPGTLSFAPVNGADDKRSFLRLSVVPADAVLWDRGLVNRVIKQMENER